MRVSSVLLAAGLVLFASSAVSAGGVAILQVVLADDGDHDGFADTNETVSITLRVRNTSGIGLTNVSIRLSTRDPQRACISDSLIEVGSLAAGEERVTTDAFVLSVPPGIDRGSLGSGPLDDLSAAFDLSVSSQPANQAAVPPTFVLDLDLNAASGSGASTFVESFEGDLGAFEIENLDQGKATLAASDGWRCQYHDPDWVNSNNFDDPSGAECFLGNSAEHADAVFWGLSGPAFSPLGGRAFSGFHSLVFGGDLGPPRNWTTPMAVLEAVRTTAPVNLGWNGVTPTLSFKHQVSFVDSRSINAEPGEAPDRGVVMVQRADAAGNPVGFWIKLDAYQNPYDQTGSDNFFGCMYDPIDDGSTEDDFFEPADPDRRTGPSTTCNPARIYADIGETSEAFAPGNVGRADGPGLAGVWGIGTWIESRFDLSRFRGQRIRIRFLATVIKYPPNLDTWEDLFEWNPLAGDDGWWIDDVSVSGTLTEPALVTVDAADNSALTGLPGGDGDGDAVFNACDNCAGAANSGQADADADGQGDVCDPCPVHAFVLDPDSDGVCLFDNCPLTSNPTQTNADGDPAGVPCDCDDGDDATYPGAAEINDGRDNQCPGDDGFGTTDEISGLVGFHSPADDDTLSWPAQAGVTRYRVARAQSADFSGCVLMPVTGNPFIFDGAPLAVGERRYYLVRAQLPHLGSWGADSAGLERDLPCD